MDGYTLCWVVQTGPPDGFCYKNGWLSTTDVTKKLLGLYFAWVIQIIIFVEYSIPQKTSKLVVELKNSYNQCFVFVKMGTPTWQWARVIHEGELTGPVRGPVFEHF